MLQDADTTSPVVQWLGANNPDDRRLSLTRGFRQPEDAALAGFLEYRRQLDAEVVRELDEQAAQRAREGTLAGGGT